jgi:virginiamycin A acetyltransferase
MIRHAYKKFRQKVKERRHKFTFESPVAISPRAIIDKRSDIGKYTYIGDCKMISPVKMGRYCSVAHDVFAVFGNHPFEELTTHPFTYTNQLFGFDKEYRDIPFKDKRMKERAAHPPEYWFAADIGNDVWIGAKAVIIGPVKIGNGAVIGAGAIVNKDVPPYAIVAGVPAKVLRYRFPPEIISELEALKWWEFPLHQIKHLEFDQIETCISQLKALRTDGQEDSP